MPLAEAWGSGARRWSATDRSRFANDVYGPTPNAITDNLNSAKQDRDPAQWLSHYAAGRCTYAIWWAQVKYRWHLAMDPAERSALSGIPLRKLRCAFRHRADPGPLTPLSRPAAGSPSALVSFTAVGCRVPAGTPRVA